MAKRAKPVLTKKRIVPLIGGILVLLIVGVFFLMGVDYGINNETEGIVPVDRKEGKINVLLLGVDVEGLRTDAIMVASYDIKENKAKLLSIPRDTRMYIGTRYQKINAAHAIGGMKGKIAGPMGTAEAVTRLTGIPINYYIEFSFAAIDHFSEAIGPVTFNVPDVEGNGRGMNYEDPYQNLYIHLKPGEQELVGNQVQQLLRYRKSMYKDKNGNRLGYGDGDRGRVEMQQEFLKAVVDQKLNASLILKLPDIFSALSNDIKTNLTIGQIASYAKYLQDFSSENISTYQLPGEGKMIGGGSYWVCDLEQTKILVEEVFGYDASKITIDSPDKKTKDNQKSDTSGNSKKTDTSSKATAKPSSDDDDVDEKLMTKSTPKPTRTPKPTKEPADGTDSDKSTPTPKADSGEKNDDKNDNKNDNKSDVTEENKPSSSKNEKTEQTAAPSENKNTSSDANKTQKQEKEQTSEQKSDKNEDKPSDDDQSNKKQIISLD